MLIITLLLVLDKPESHRGSYATATCFGQVLRAIVAYLLPTVFHAVGSRQALDGRLMSKEIVASTSSLAPYFCL